ncbi:Tetratricopeptide TPR_2 repeat protein [Magnetococcus marinus MC-1]|uniref:Tetratricopeptide TPR_2 repeat protein n=1 Tax=Magnetococcus marinus (strain ATCC BAA-1437 / JCM 17883 / MC-1) TaxID=156889 RepID=A0L8Y1_MAGMM|nr:tetratricopeptide repeat protein [Magnetococcus marinus]ABK44424.1 Tetratricopeptide TPR_2 repeat protein [Magnetococcus marinus MC-1]
MLKTETRITLTLTSKGDALEFSWLHENAALGSKHKLTAEMLQPLHAALSGYWQAYARATTPLLLQEAALQAASRELHALFIAPVWPELTGLLPMDGEPPLLLSIRCNTPQPLSWPFELIMLEDAPETPLGLRQDLYIRRLPAGSRDSVRCCTTLPPAPLRSFFIAHANANAAALAEQEGTYLQTIAQAMAVHHHEIIPRVGDAILMNDLRQAIHQFQPHIIHLNGALVMDEQEGPVILFDGPKGAPQQVTASQFEEEILRNSGAQAVVISARINRSGESPMAAIHAFAHQLSAVSGCFVLTCAKTMASAGASAFFTPLYAALAAGKSLDHALTRGCLESQQSDDLSGHFNAGAPVLYGENARSLLINNAADAPRIHPEPLQEHFPVPDQAIFKVPQPFTGRRMERMAHEEALHSGATQALLLYGPEGVGKSALGALFAWSLSRGQHIPIVLNGSPANPITVHRLVEAVAQVLLHHGLHEEHELLDSEQLTLESRLSFLVELLNRRLCAVILLDGLDHSMNNATGTFADPLLKKWLSTLLVRLSGVSRLILTSRIKPQWEAAVLPHTAVILTLESVPKADYLKGFFNHAGLIKRLAAGDLTWPLVEQLYGLFLATFAPVRLLLNWADTLPADALAECCQEILAHDQVPLDPYSNHAPGSDASGQALMRQILQSVTEEEALGWQTWAVTRVWLPLSSLETLCELPVEHLSATLNRWVELGVAQSLPGTDTSDPLYRLTPFVREALQSKALCVNKEVCQRQHLRMGEILKSLILSDRSGQVGSSWFDLLLEAREHFFQGGDIAAYFEFSESVGTALARHGHIEAAIRLHMDARERSGQPAPMVSIARLYLETNRPDEARTWLERAVEASTGGKHPTVEGAALQTMAAMAMSERHVKQARVWLEQALAVQHQHHDAAGEAASLNQLANITLAEGDLAQGMTHLQAALPLWKKAGNRVNRAATLHQLGILFLQSGDMTEALKHLEKGLALYRLLGNGQDLGMLLSQLGGIYFQKQSSDTAKAYFEEAMEYLEQEPVLAPQLSFVLHQLATIHLNSGALKEAELHLKKALLLKQKLDDRRGEAAAFFQLGRLAKEKDKVEEAMRLIGISYHIDVEIGNPDAHQELEVFNFIAQSIEMPEYEAEMIMQEAWELYSKDRGHSLIAEIFPVPKTIPIKMMS